MESQIKGFFRGGGGVFFKYKNILSTEEKIIDVFTSFHPQNA